MTFYTPMSPAMPEYTRLSWRDPLRVAEALYRRAPHDHFAFFYSGLQTDYSGNISLIALNPVEILATETWERLAQELTTNAPAFANAWAGFLQYELAEHLPITAPTVFPLPPIGMVRYATWLRFDHATFTVECFGEAISWPDDAVHAPPAIPPVTSLGSNLSRDAYWHIVSDTRDAIHAGEFYQANITRKFFGEFAAAPDAFTLFAALCQRSPAPYSAFIQWNDTHIISSSPERFITADNTGVLRTRPIKGSAPRYTDPATDNAARMALENSEKDRAENLMIVDLMRNDMARVCVPGSVRTTDLHSVHSYATIHHMSSEVVGRLAPAATSLAAVRACFPPGSMTGAPKIRAMQWCAAQEAVARGVYSGALGWFGGDGSMDVSVVIRTVLLHGKRFEFQVGGGIVADSDPHMEWRETLTKARAIADILGITAEELAGL